MTAWKWMACALVSGVMVACGGGAEGPSLQPATNAKTVWADASGQDLINGQASGIGNSSYGKPVEGVDRVRMQQRLSKFFNGKHASDPESLMGNRRLASGFAAYSGSTKDFSRQPLPVYRFFNNSTGVHFYTMSDQERDAISATLPQFSLEGRAFYVLPDFDVPRSPVYRFYSIYTGTHFYTIDSEEMYYVRTNYAEYFNFEGVAWWATTHAGPGWMPVHRFFNTASSTHFYTTSEEERLKQVATAPYMEYEGIAYYVRADGIPWQGSSVTNSRTDTCIGPTGLYDTGCAMPDALPTAAQVDGRRPAPQFMVTERFESLGECARDSITGLVWEKKAYSGLHDNTLRVTHLTGSDEYQVMTSTGTGSISYVPRKPSALEIASSENSVGFIAAVNAQSHCGFNDWRLPSASELINVMHFGHRWLEFPPLFDGRYLTADSVAFNHDTINGQGQTQSLPVQGVVSVTTFPSSLTAADFIKPVLDVRYRAIEAAGTFSSDGKFSIVLVRGPQTSEASRFSVISLPYGRDQSNNALVDNVTQLQWRRCLEGQIWNGVACSGQPLTFDLYGALSLAINRPGWRMPGVKELQSLQRWDVAPGQPFTWADVTPTNALPGQNLAFWSGSVYGAPVLDPLSGLVKTPAYQVGFQNTVSGLPSASIGLVSRDRAGFVRLTRVHP
ncbi:DUF1566 domain-containing protein [Hydrogenophaga sp. RWCD_12]|uniref:Lcl domain-containing protein n=1 Tax=Hydrogenophaga sp. RWCD_12 TaxID=3391190 RepID=UPI0039849B8A